MALARNGCAMEFEKRKKNLTLNSRIRVEGVVVVLVRAAAPISRLAFFSSFYKADAEFE